MKLLILSALLFEAFGCQPQVSGPVVSNEPAPKVETKEPPKEPVAEPEQLKDSRYKPERIHQLKDLDTRKMKVGAHDLTVWIMDNESKREEGMMWLVDKDVKDTEGMLFLFQDAKPRNFWMQNCPTGLDIVYIDAKSKVINIGVGKPFDESGVPCKGDAQFVLELKPGRAAKFGIKPGTVLNLPKDVHAKE